MNIKTKILAFAHNVLRYVNVWRGMRWAFYYIRDRRFTKKDKQIKRMLAAYLLHECEDIEMCAMINGWKSGQDYDIFEYLSHKCATKSN